jgi:gliding motility-associated-like protein
MELRNYRRLFQQSIILIPLFIRLSGNQPTLAQVVTHTPIAEFSLDTTVFCSLPHKVVLHSTSINADQVAWYCNGMAIAANPDTVFQLTREEMPAETWKEKYSHQVNRIPFVFMLIARNNEGVTDTMKRVINVSLPVARFTTDRVSGCVPLTVNFTDESQSPFSVTSRIYHVENTLLNATAAIPVSHTFTTPGNYHVWEVIQSDNCTDTSYSIVIVAGEKLTPLLNVTPKEICTGGTVHLSATSNNNDAVDGWEIFSEPDFRYSFTARPDTLITVSTDSTGSRDINLRLNYNGCISETSLKEAFLIKGPAGKITESFSCDSPLVYRFRTDMSPYSSLEWKIDTAIFADMDSVIYRFPKSGDYQIMLTARDAASSCMLSSSMRIPVRQPDAAFTLSDTILCVGDTLVVDASGSSDYLRKCVQEGFLWNFGDDSPPRRTFLTGYSHIYNSRGTDTVSLYMLAANGCMDSLSKVVQVFRPEGSFITDTTAGCLPGVTITFISTSADTSIVSWKWDFGDKASAGADSIVRHTYEADSAKTCYATLTVYDRHQCSSTIGVPIELVEGISEVHQTDTTLYYGNSLELKVHSSRDNLNYTWTPDQYITCLDCANPVITPVHDITYLVKAVKDCYSLTETINIEVVRDFYLEAPTAFTPNGDGTNDVFRFESSNIGAFEVHILNRWGEVVFTADDVGCAWDGTVNGRLQNTDTYVWVAKVVSTHGYAFEKKGNVLLLK